MGFSAVHVHPFLVAALWAGFSWWNAAALYLSMLVTVSIVLAVPDYLERPASFGGASLGIILGATWLQAPAGLV